MAFGSKSGIHQHKHLIFATQYTQQDLKLFANSRLLLDAQHLCGRVNSRTRAVVGAEYMGVVMTRAPKFHATTPAIVYPDGTVTARSSLNAPETTAMLLADAFTNSVECGITGARG